MIVKVCGMKYAENIREVDALGIDWMGFIFYEKSPRFAGTVPPSYLPKNCRRVGVFVNSELAFIRSMVHAYALDFIQLHGNESPEFCKELMESVPAVQLIKAFSIASSADLGKTSLYEGIVQYFLFDTATKAYGGSGRSFDWTVLEAYHGHTPFLLSGGIGPETVQALAAFRHPLWCGIDLNSRFETAPGKKDAALLKTALDALPSFFRQV